MKNEPQFEFEVSFNPEGESNDKVLQLLQSDGIVQYTREPDRLGFTGIEIVYACVLVGSVLFNLVLRLVELWQCGVIVDTRPKKPTITKSCELLRGSVLIIRNDGTQAEFKKTEDLKIDEFLKGATELLKGSKSEIEKKA